MTDIQEALVNAKLLPEYIEGLEARIKFGEQGTRRVRLIHAPRSEN
jgi:hypothetical protein